jgi:hypothetical protein
MTCRAAISLLVLALGTAKYSAAALASHPDVVKILRTEKFKLAFHVSQISHRDWVAAGVHPQGRSITESMVDAGHSYQSEDYTIGDMALRQLFLVAKNRRHEILAFWEGTIGGPVLRVLMLQRDGRKPKLIFYAIMNNDIPQNSWTWYEVTRHILQDKMDILMSAEHPDTYDNRLP